MTDTTVHPVDERLPAPRLGPGGYGGAEDLARALAPARHRRAAKNPRSRPAASASPMPE